ncbi:MAG: 4a-hydroxytetrahydrobiopterin dehydratase [Candidatus Aenigmarchaeota archaeon]|nr:4a-hydroxytetrahydrobiopterin dehydratase [Candidatus Aenigmarchaeota archaeon]
MLANRKCVPCEGGIKPMTKKEAEEYLSQVKDWSLAGHKIGKEFVFKDFKEAMKFVNKVAEIAESERHHPDIRISWNRVGLDLSTHAIRGLSENDFIVAAKIDRLEK